MNRYGALSSQHKILKVRFWSGSNAHCVLQVRKCPGRQVWAVPYHRCLGQTMGLLQLVPAQREEATLWC